MKSRHSVRSDLYDLLAFATHQRERDSLRQLLVAGGEVHPNFPFLIEDVFRYLYKEKPEFHTDKHLAEDHKIQREILKALAGQGLNELRQETVLEEDAAVRATEEVGKTLLDLLKNASQPTPQSGEGQEGDELDRLLREFLERVGKNPERLRELLQRSRGKERPTEGDEAQGIVKELEAGFGYRERFVDRRSELEEALEEVADLRKFAKSLGKVALTNIRQKLLLAFEGEEEIYDIDLGRDLTRVLPFELSKLVHSTLQKLFWLRYLQRSLLSHKLRSRRPLGKGPKIYLVDLSGSTDSPNHIRQGLEKLVAIALTIYSKKNPHFLVIYFQDNNRMNLPKLPLHNPPTVEEWQDLATRWGSGGTDFDVPLKEALRLIRDDPNFARADVIMLTDGEANLDNQFVAWINEEKKRLDFAIVSILIDWGGTVKESEVQKISDRVLFMKDLLPHEVLQQITRIYDGKGPQEPLPPEPPPQLDYL